MNSQQIEFFLAAAKHLNFTKVAEELHSSQPTVSRQLALLEEELGIALFSRSKGMIRLTPGGAVLVQTFTKIQKDLEEAIELIARASEGHDGKISIGHLSHMNTDMFVYPTLLEFSRLYPSIDVSVGAETFSELRRKLADGSYDIIFTYSFELPSLEFMHYEKVYAVSPMIVMSSTHPLANKPDCKLSDFDGQTFILPDQGESRGRAAGMLNICRNLGIKNAEIRFVDNIDSMMFSILSGWGVGLISSGMNCIFDSRYSCFPLPQESFDEYIAMAWNATNLNPVIPLYMEVLSRLQNIDVFRAFEMH